MTPLLRRAWPLIPLTCLLLACAVGMGRQKHNPAPAAAAPTPPPTPMVVSMPPMPVGFLKVPPAVPQEGPPELPAAPNAPLPAQDKAGIDRLIDQLEQLRAQKAQLEQQEKVIVEKLRTAVTKQNDRLAKLGVEVAPKPEPTPVSPVIPGGGSIPAAGGSERPLPGLPSLPPPGSLPSPLPK